MTSTSSFSGGVIRRQSSLVQSIFDVQIENTMAIHRPVNSIDHNHEEDVEASGGHKHMVIMAELAAVNILHTRSINNLLRQSDQILNHANVGPNVDAIAGRLGDVGHLVFGRGL